MIAVTIMERYELESIATVRDALGKEAALCAGGSLEDLWRGMSEDLRRLAAGEPVAGDEDD